MVAEPATGRGVCRFDVGSERAHLVVSSDGVAIFILVLVLKFAKVLCVRLN